MKKYLYITPLCPFPPHKNGAVHTTYNIIMNKPNNIEMDLLYYADKDVEAENELKKYFNRIYFSKIMSKATLLKKIITLVKGKPNLLADIEMSDFSIDFKDSDYDVVIYDQITSTEFLKIVKGKEANIVMMHDNYALLYSRKAKVEKSLLKRLFDRLQTHLLKKWDRIILPQIDRLIYASKLDCEMVQKDNAEYKSIIHFFPLGVDIPESSRISEIVSRHSLVFSGVMDYKPNEDAAIYVAKEILPKVLKMYPDCTFMIAGKNPTEKINKLKSDNIIITGYVDDMVSTITKSAVYISPLRVGSGMKNKVLEAMAAEMPVLLSPISREGIEGLIDKENCMFVEDGEWISKIDEIFKNDELRRKISRNGKKFVEQKHSWNHVFDNFVV